MGWPPSDEELMAEHEGLVRKQALRIRSRMELTTELEDLIAYGYQGLLEARDRFDPERGVRFTTFAYYRIRGAILDGVREMAYLPRRVHTMRKAAEAFDRAAEEVAAERAKDPEARRELAKTLQSVDEILGKTCAAFVISAVGQSPEVLENPEQDLLSAETRVRVRAAVELLPERERKLVEEHYFGDRTLDEIGQEMGISKSWASRLCTRALARLRGTLGDST